MFFAVSAGGLGSSLVSTTVLTLTIVFSAAMTLLVSKLLSKTVLRGLPSSFILELPPYRAPQFGKVIVRSIADRTLFVLFRAVVVAAPVQVADLVTGRALAVVRRTDDAGDADGSPTGERADRQLAVALGGQ